MSALPPKADIARQLASADSTRSCAANATLTRLKSIRLLAELSEKRERSRFVELDAWALVVNAGNLQIESEIDRAVRAGIGIRLADSLSLSSSGSLKRGHLKIYSVIPERIFVLPITEETNRSSNGSAHDNLRPISSPCHDRPRQTPTGLDSGLDVGASFLLAASCRKRCYSAAL
jgi:hypothetical protein